MTQPLNQGFRIKQGMAKANLRKHGLSDTNITVVDGRDKLGILGVQQVLAARGYQLNEVPADDVIKLMLMPDIVEQKVLLDNFKTRQSA